MQQFSDFESECNFNGLPEAWCGTGLGLMGACLEYLITLGLDFVADSLSQLRSVVAFSVSVSLNRCFFTCPFFCNTEYSRGQTWVHKHEENVSTNIQWMPTFTIGCSFLVVLRSTEEWMPLSNNMGSIDLRKICNKILIFKTNKSHRTFSMGPTCSVCHRCLCSPSKMK